jgi:hypothetical protein
MAYGARFSELVNIEAEYPAMAEWLFNVEERTQEYRGRVDILKEQHPRVYAQVDKLRKQTQPNPMRLTILKDHAPDVYDTIVSIPREQAIQKGRTDPTNYIGHGGLSSSDLRELTTATDDNQRNLCQNCPKSGCSRHSVVEEKTEQAKRELSDGFDTRQESLLDELPPVQDSHQIIEDAVDDSVDATEDAPLTAF